MKLTILAPESELFSGEVIKVRVPACGGAFEILENHAPIISLLNPGTIRIVEAPKKQTQIEIKGGIVECAGNNVYVLAKPL